MLFFCWLRNEKAKNVFLAPGSGEREGDGESGVPGVANVLRCCLRRQCAHPPARISRLTGLQKTTKLSIGVLSCSVQGFFIGGSSDNLWIDESCQWSVQLKRQWIGWTMSMRERKTANNICDHALHYLRIRLKSRRHSKPNSALQFSCTWNSPHTRTHLPSKHKWRALILLVGKGS